ncbi:12596_t:CDS:2 [Funneliformis caledonium]|uniref:12596_t:CDS:1 n=1 Tax=Funneliformis caledonium TaxID=1117310 RepID=A0A9N9HN80_9GLOM|nr:12596_t:CDS:2 [Funneliformis caledonium]
MKELTNISNVLSTPKILNTPNTSRITRSSTINIGLDKRVAKDVGIKNRIDLFDVSNALSNLKGYLLNDDEILVDDFTSENEMANSNYKRKVNEINDIENKDMDMQKRNRIALTISNIYDMQTQMIVMIQDIQKKINEMYTN